MKATCLFLFIIQPKWMCERNITCTNNASSSSSSLSQIIITIPYPPLPSSLLSYTSLFFLYLDWKPGPRCKGDSTLQLWCRAWSVWLSSGLLSSLLSTYTFLVWHISCFPLTSSIFLSQKDSFLKQCCSSIPVNSSIINLVLEVHCKGTSRVMLSKFWGSDLLVAQWQIVYCIPIVPELLLFVSCGVMPSKLYLDNCDYWSMYMWSSSIEYIY